MHTCLDMDVIRQRLVDNGFEKVSYKLYVNYNGKDIIINGIYFFNVTQIDINDDIIFIEGFGNGKVASNIEMGMSLPPETEYCESLIIQFDIQ